MTEHNGENKSNIAEADETYLAGQKVPAGTYRELGTFRSVQLESDDYLPASLNGRVAVYVKKPPTFAELLHRHLRFGKTN